MRAHIARAVYHVELQDADQRVRAGGTAWVVGPNMLATNAHVGILREGLRARERMIVRAPGQNGQIYEVVEHKLHPGYVPFHAFLDSDLRLLSTYRGNFDALSGNGYDVALLRTAGTLPEADRLEIATTQEMNGLVAGTPLATQIYRAVRGVAPDLIVHFGALAWRSVGGVGYSSVHVRENDTGPDDCNHAQHGAFILAAPNHPLQGEVEGAHLLDIAPTLLELGGHDRPPSMKARSLVVGGPSAPRGEVGFSEPDERTVRDRLSGLGYLG